MGELGERAEREVQARIRAALPDGARCFANVRWLAPTSDGGAARNGEIDLLLVLPRLGILVRRNQGWTHRPNPVPTVVRGRADS